MTDIKLRVGALVVALCLVAVPASATAQASLNDVESLANSGRADEARASLLDWWESGREGANRADLQRGLWLRGRLTVDPTQAARDFRRLVVEYPGGPYTDSALFRLAQAAHAGGEEERARNYMASLSRDYPNSAVRREAEAWLVRAGPPPTRAMTTGERVSTGEDRAVPPTTSPERGAPPETRSPAPTEAPRTDPPATTGRYSVQLGAFSGAERAESLRQRAADAGLVPRIVNVQGSRLIHVRVGRFDSSGEASVFSRTVTDLGFTAAVVRDADKEESARQ